MSVIIITEKPAVAREYRSVLQLPDEPKKGYYEDFSPVMQENVIITWAVGHLIEMCNPNEIKPEWKKWDKANIPMIPEQFSYKLNESTKEQFEVVKSLYLRKDIDCIYYAGDSGREGIYIQALIRNQIFSQTPKFQEKVVWIDSYTEESIRNGIKNAKPYSEYQHMVQSGYARAISDWLIGMNFTEAVSLSANVLIKIGRVMTPTLAMIVKRQEEIDSFVKTDYYGIKAGTANWKATKGSRFEDSPQLYNETGFLKEEDAKALQQELNQDKQLQVEDVQVQKKTEYAPYLFNLADLQAYCSRVMKITPTQTLQYVQKLYEKKYVTYPRTDCRFLSSAVAKDLQKYGYNIPKRYINDAKVKDHYAIIPVVPFDNSANLSGTELQIFEAIKKRFLDTMKPPFVYDSVSVTYLHSNGERFYDSFRIIKDKGFKEDVDEDNSGLQMPVKGAVIAVSEFAIKNMETRPPSKYTTGTLILAMEKAGKLIEDEELREQIKTSGIGTSATRDYIIEKLAKVDKRMNTSYITIDNNQVVTPTEFGKKVIPIVEQFDSTLISPVKTAEMENKLSAIENGEIDYEEYLTAVKQYVTEISRSMVSKSLSGTMSAYQQSPSGGESHIDGKCPKCGGEIGKGQYGYYCKSRCGMVIGKLFGHELSEKMIQQLVSGKAATYQDGGKVRTVLPEFVENVYNGKTMYIWKIKTETSKVQCPCCGGELQVGKYSWSCQCGFKFGKEICGHEMKEADLKALNEDGKTPVYQFTSKAGKPFRACLVLDKSEKKTNFEFENK